MVYILATMKDLLSSTLALKKSITWLSRWEVVLEPMSPFMEETFNKALFSVLGGEIPSKEFAVPSAKEILKSSDLGVVALEHYNKAKVYLQEGN